MTTEIGYRESGCICFVPINREGADEPNGGLCKGKGSDVVKCRSEKHPRRAQRGGRGHCRAWISALLTHTAADAGCLCL